MMSLLMFIIPQYPAIILKDGSLPIINLQCRVLLYQSVQICWILQRKRILHTGTFLTGFLNLQERNAS